METNWEDQTTNAEHMTEPVQVLLKTYCSSRMLVKQNKIWKDI